MPLTKLNQAERLTGIGASEIAAVAGIPGAFGSPLSVYEAKVGAGLPVEENDAMRWGNFMEPRVLAWLPEETGLIIRPNNHLNRHPVHKFCIATPDGFAFEESDPQHAVATVEVKAPMFPGDKWVHPDEDSQGAPDIYLVQCQWQMLATGLSRCILAALVERPHPWVYMIDANAELQAALLERAVEFWARVEARDPPLDDLRASDSERLSRMLRQKSDALAIPEPSEAAILLDAAITYSRASEAIKAAEEVKQLAAAKLKAAIGDKAGMDLGSVRVSWRANKPTPEVDWKAVVEDLAPPADVLNRHTTIRSRARPIRVTPKKEGK